MFIEDIPSHKCFIWILRVSQALQKTNKEVLLYTKKFHHHRHINLTCKLLLGNLQLKVFTLNTFISFKLWNLHLENYPGKRFFSKFWRHLEHFSTCWPRQWLCLCLKTINLAIRSLHQWPTGAHRHSRKTYICPWQGNCTAPQKSPENKPGKIHFHQQRSFIAGVLIDSGRNQSRKKQAKSNQGCKTSSQHQNIQIIHWLVQLIQDAHQGLALISAPLFKLTSKNSGYKAGPPPEGTKLVFLTLQRQLTLEPVVAFPKSNCHYTPITNTATGMANTPGRLGAILMHVDKDGNF